jgi:hypothetical protein
MLFFTLYIVTFIIRIYVTYLCVHTYINAFYGQTKICLFENTFLFILEKNVLNLLYGRLKIQYGRRR